MTIFAQPAPPHTSAIRSRHDLLGPLFLLKAGNKLSEDIAADVTKFEFNDDEKKNAQLKLVVANRGLKYLDDDRFREGVNFEVRWGYVNDISDVFKAYIVRAKPVFPQDGVPTIEMVAFDVRREMNKRGQPKNWGPVQSSDVAREIATRYGLQADIEDSMDNRKNDRLQPASMTDIQYLQSLASPINFDCYVEGDTLHFHHKRYELSPSLVFWYYSDARGTLLDFSPEIDTSKPPGQGKTGADTKTGAAHKKSATDADTGTKLGRVTINAGDAKVGDVQNDPTVLVGIGEYPYGKTYSMVADIGAMNKYYIEKATAEHDAKVAAIHAVADRQKVDMSAVKASATIVGTPRLKAKQNIRIEGVGRTYSGVWRVESVVHTISADNQTYVCKLKLTRNALNKPKDNSKGGGSGSGSDSKDVNDRQIVPSIGVDANKAKIINPADVGSVSRKVGI